MMRSKYNFVLTMEQRVAIRDMGLADSDVYLCPNGMVSAIVFTDFEITCYAFGKIGGVVKETRGLESGGWDTTYLGLDGVWTNELGEKIDV